MGWILVAIKLIATDLNGTLLHQDQRFDQDRFKRILMQLKTLSVPVVLSSGNQYAHLQQLFKNVMSDNLIVVAENGASIYAHDQLIFDGSLSADQQRQFVTVDRHQPLFKDAYVILVGSHGSYTEVGAPDKLVAMARQFYDNLHLVADLTSVDDKIKKSVFQRNRRKLLIWLRRPITILVVSYGHMIVVMALWIWLISE